MTQRITSLRMTGDALVPRGAQEHAEIVVSKEHADNEEETAEMKQADFENVLLKAGVDVEKAEALATMLAKTKPEHDETAKALKEAFAAPEAEAAWDELDKDKVAKGDEVVYTSTETGEVFTAKSDPALVNLRKENDQMRAEQRSEKLAKRFGAIVAASEHGADVVKAATASVEVRKSLGEAETENPVLKGLEDINRKLAQVTQPSLVYKGDGFEADSGEQISHDEFVAKGREWAKDKGIEGEAAIYDAWRNSDEGMAYRARGFAG